MQRLALIVGAFLAVAMVSTAFAQGPVTVQLNAMNNSGVSGSAIVTDAGNNQTKVELFMLNEPVGGNEPANINVGQCGSTLGAVKYSLGNVQFDTNTATVNAPIDSLQNGTYAINVQTSKTDTTSVACGVIPAIAGTNAASPTALPATGGVPPLAALLVAGALLGGGYVIRPRSAPRS